MEEAPENGKESLHSAHANGLNEWLSKGDVTTKEHVEKLTYLIKVWLWPWIIKRHAKWRWNQPVKFNGDTKWPGVHRHNYSTFDNKTRKQGIFYYHTAEISQQMPVEYT